MGNIKVVHNDNVLIIKFNKPRKKNALDYAMYVESTKLINDAATDKNISVVVLTGVGDFYCSGNDFDSKNDVPVDTLLKAIEDFVNAIILFPKICVAIVNGPAIGIAVTTLPLCDFVYAAESAFFYTPFTKLGIVSEACSSFTFPRLMGERKSREMLMLNYKMSSKEALKCGLVSNVYKTQELESKAWNNIKYILNLPQKSLLSTKKLLREPYIKRLVDLNHTELQELKALSQSKL